MAARIKVEYTAEGIATAKEAWADEFTKPDKVEDEKLRAYQEYVRHIADYYERRMAQVVNHARKLGEQAVMLQQQADAREQEQARIREEECNLEREFRALAEAWYTETMPLSSYVDKVLHPAYLRIIGLGRNVVPFIMDELRDMPHDWFLALRAITGKDPVNPEDAGNLSKMAESWLHWWEQEGRQWLAQGTRL
ncbi:MAG TPA: hypothetical protein VF544_24190 [Pyrinomonadaceae bacterium]|jgi:hypothetical protein